MTTRRDSETRTRPPRNDRGAALILTVVVVMVLTTLALTMATFTTTEERTANTYRDAMQTRAIAEAGVRIVQEAFRSPDDRALVPLYNAAAVASNTVPPAYDYFGTTDAQINTQLEALGIWRAVRVGANPPLYSGNQNRFFQPPFKDNWAQVFAGLYNPDPNLDVYDLKFNCTNPTTGAVVPAADCWLEANFNSLLENTGDVHTQTGRITDISFYGPPTENGKAYGICTVRVTAEKTDGPVVTRETVEAVIVDLNPKPAVLGNGSIVFKVQAGTLCGDGCEQIHANGDADVGPITGGKDPMVTATGDITGGATSKDPGATAVVAPEINPWDLNYRPTLSTELDKYYLVASRQLDAVWTDNNPANPAPRPCGLGLYSWCQDYNLEYTEAGAVKPDRTAGSTPYMYKWDVVNNEWDECGSGINLSCSLGGPTFTVDRNNDLAVAGTGDNNEIPFRKDRVPKTRFQIQTPMDGATVLVDGQFYKHGAMTATMTIVAAGSIEIESSTTWYPAMQNRTMWVSGRDIKTHANCCAPSNTCATNLGVAAAAGIIAAHEQIATGSQNALLGLLIAEHKVDYDDMITSNLAINSDNGDHGSLCNKPSWPWTMPVKPGLASLKTAAR